MRTKITNIRLRINHQSFVNSLVHDLENNNGSFHSVITEVFLKEASKSFAHLKSNRKILDYKIKTYPYPPRDINSLKDALEKKEGYTFWYFEVTVTTEKGHEISENQILKPEGASWLPFNYGPSSEVFFKFKCVKKKTQNNFKIEYLQLILPHSVLLKAYKKSSLGCDCESSFLRAETSGVWDWQVTFACAKCGKKYLCNCFKKAIEIQKKLHKTQILDRDGYPIDGRYSGYTLMDSASIKNKNIVYRKNICHICTGQPSSLFYCSPMYGSDVMVKYGPYIEKIRIEKNLSRRDAEDKIRVKLELPKIGEGWVNETQLFKILCHIFNKKNVVREASPAWLERLRLDFYIPKLQLGIEYQGQQHFEPIDRFGGKESFLRGQRRDKQKQKLCKKNGVQLIYFDYSENLDEELVRKKLRSFLKNTF